MNLETVVEDPLLKAFLNVFVLMGEYVERQKELELLINNLNEQLKDIKSGIILSTENANRSGRPPLTDDEIDFIRKLREQGLSQREVAERVGVSNGAVAKYDIKPKPKSKKIPKKIDTDPLNK